MSDLVFPIFQIAIELRDLILILAMGGWLFTLFMLLWLHKNFREILGDLELSYTLNMIYEDFIKRNKLRKKLDRYVNSRLKEEKQKLEQKGKEKELHSERPR